MGCLRCLLDFAVLPARDLIKNFCIAPNDFLADALAKAQAAGDDDGGEDEQGQRDDKRAARPFNGTQELALKLSSLVHRD